MLCKDLMVSFTKDFLLGHINDCLSDLTDLLNESAVKKSVLFGCTVKNNAQVCRHQPQNGSAHETGTSFEDLLAVVKGLPPTSIQFLLECVLIYNSLMSQMHQTHTDLIEGVTNLVSSKVQDILKRARTSVLQPDPLALQLIVCLQELVLLLQGLAAEKEPEDVSILPKSSKQKKQSWCLFMKMDSGNIEITEDSCEGKGSLRSIRNFIRTWRYCQLGNWTRALSAIKGVEKGLYGRLHTAIQYTKAFCLYKSGLVQNSAQKLQKLLQRSDLDISVKVKSHHLSGCCLAKMGKPNLAIQQFRQSLREDTSLSMVPSLYNIWCLYRQMRKHDAELEALNLLVKSLDCGEDGDDCDRGHDLYLRMQPDVSYEDSASTRTCYQITALYLLAKRCFELKRYLIAAEMFQDLVSLIADSPVIQMNLRYEFPVALPTIPQVYAEAAIAFLHGDRIEEAISLCGIVISHLQRSIKVKDTEQEVNLISQIKTDKNNSQGSQSDAKVKKNITGHKRSLSPQDESGLVKTSDLSLPRGHKDQMLLSGEDANEEYFCMNRYLLALAYFVKSEGMFKNGDFGASLRHTETVLKLLNEHTCSRNAEQEEGDMPDAKRRRLDTVAEIEETHVSSPIMDQPRWRELKGKAYSNKSLLLIGQGKYKEALPVLLCSLECFPESVETRFNYCLLLFKLERKKEAYAEYRKLPK